LTIGVGYDAAAATDAVVVFAVVAAAAVVVAAAAAVAVVAAVAGLSAFFPANACIELLRATVLTSALVPWAVVASLHSHSNVVQVVCSTKCDADNLGITCNCSLGREVLFRYVLVGVYYCLFL
jgi:hypothetical protein